MRKWIQQLHAGQLAIVATFLVACASTAGWLARGDYYDATAVENLAIAINQDLQRRGIDPVNPAIARQTINDSRTHGLYWTLSAILLISSAVYASWAWLDGRKKPQQPWR